MNFKRIITFTVFSAIVFPACKNKLDVLAPYKDVTVVYGLMDQTDPVDYIRINKGFEGSGNAYIMAKQYDSIYYPANEITALLEDSNPNTNVIVNKIKLDTTTTVPLGPGTFPYPKQLLYYTNATLNPNDYYNLVVTNTKTGKTLRGSTYLLPDISLIYPRNLSNKSIPLTLGSNPYPTEVGWNSTSSAIIYQMSILFYYDAQVNSGPRALQAPLQLVFAEQTELPGAAGSQMSYFVSAQQLFSLMLASIQPQNGVTRYADSLGLVFTTGTGDLNTYIQLSLPNNGINQDIPSFTDVENGIGLYTARHVQTYYRSIDNALLDSLYTDARLKSLNFQP